MRTAQQLYEGIDLGDGPVGLITYMRTDSVALAGEAIGELREFIARQYGAGDLPDRPRVYRTKSKNAQEAHEAIRPTSCARTPERVRKFLNADQHRLYSLIWKRAVASQMMHATLNLVAAELACGEGNTFRATGSSVKNPGFMKVYREGLDDTRTDADERMLPALEVGEAITLNAVRAEQHFTEPPPRFTEASLVKTLEEFGIGRPSTYASIISTLQSREYTELESRRFTPTEMGRLVNRFLTKHFAQYVDYDFTAHLENDLDEISRGEKEWVPVLHAFWDPFNTLILDKEKPSAGKRPYRPANSVPTPGPANRSVCAWGGTDPLYRSVPGRIRKNPGSPGSVRGRKWRSFPWMRRWNCSNCHARSVKPDRGRRYRPASAASDRT